MSETRPFRETAGAAGHPQAARPVFVDVGGPPSRASRCGGGLVRARERCGRASSGSAVSSRTWLSAKASRLDDWAAENGRALLRFDYSGHGELGGSFEAGTISLWLEESLAVLRAMTEGPSILVGSSMGGWIALLIARALAQAEEAARLAGMVLIAPATDFTEALIFPRLPPEAREAIRSSGVWLRPSPYSPEPYPITRALIEDGRRHLLFGSTIHSHCPVHILQGMQDADVPWRHAVSLVEHLAGDPVTLTLVKDGDHRLSRDEDMARLIAAVAAIA